MGHSTFGVTPGRIRTEPESTSSGGSRGASPAIFYILAFAALPGSIFECKKECVICSALPARKDASASAFPITIMTVATVRSVAAVARAAMLDLSVASPP